MQNTEILANVAHILAAKGADVSLEHGSAQDAYDHIKSNAEEYTECLDLFGHNYSVEVYHAVNGVDIAAYFVNVRVSDHSVDQHAHGDLIACYAYVNESDAVSAALAVIKRLNDLKPTMTDAPREVTPSFYITIGSEEEEVNLEVRGPETVYCTCVDISLIDYEVDEDCRCAHAAGLVIDGAEYHHLITFDWEKQYISVHIDGESIDLFTLHSITDRLLSAYRIASA